MKTALIYHKNYNFKVPSSLARCFHKFDSEKYRKAYHLLWELRKTKREESEGDPAEEHIFSPTGEISKEDIAAVHTHSYLESLSDPKVVSRIIESWPLSYLSASMLDERLLSPMRWSVAGTLLAMKKVLLENYEVVFNLGGGYHHAFPEHGEGFCVYNDLAISLQHLKSNGMLKEDDIVAVVDLDAHFGNGNAAFFGKSPNVKFFDIHNILSFASANGDELSDDRWLIQTGSYTSGTTYGIYLAEKLPSFLEVNKPKFLFYLAGTDVINGDPIGRLSLSQQDVLQRDEYVLKQSLSRKIPVVVVTAGGYTSSSYKLVAQTANEILGVTSVWSPNQKKTLRQSFA
jgi:histone deacetylase 11